MGDAQTMGIEIIEGRMNFQNDVKFPAHCKPLPSGYRIVQLDSGHYLWVCDSIEGGAGEGLIDVDRWRARRGAFAHAEKRLQK
jgi:hypothetical protein